MREKPQKSKSATAAENDEDYTYDELQLDGKEGNQTDCEDGYPAHSLPKLIDCPISNTIFSKEADSTVMIMLLVSLVTRISTMIIVVMHVGNLTGRTILRVNIRMVHVVCMNNRCMIYPQLMMNIPLWFPKRT